MKKRLMRSETNKKVFGVAGGLAEYFDIDPTFVRLALLMMMLLDGTGATFITYFVATAIMPKADVAENIYVAS